MIEETVKIKEGHVPQLVKKVQGFNKKMSRSGLPEIKLDIDKDNPIGDILTNGEVEFYLNVTIKANIPVLNGWSFVATVEHKTEGNILRRIDRQVKIPEKYRDTSSILCEYCGQRRERKDTYLVTNQKVWWQVGSTCLKKGLGIEHTSPSQIAQYLSFIFSFKTTVQKIASSKPVKMRDHKYFSIRVFLAYVFYSAKQHGWVSKTNAVNGKAVATYEQAMIYMKAEIQLDACFYGYAEKALFYARHSMQITNEYYSNLKNSVCEDFAEFRDLAYIASLASVYKEYLEEIKHQHHNMMKHSEHSRHFGREGERGVFVLTVLSSKKVQRDDYNTVVYQMSDQQGNRVTWFSSAAAFLEVGKTYRLKATVKRHEDFRGQKITVVERCAIV